MGLFGPKKLKEEDYYFTLDFPFESKPQEDYSPDSFTFGHAYVQYVQLMARDWFGDSPVLAREALKNSKLVNPEDLFPPEAAAEFPILGEPSVDRSLLKSYS